MTSLQPLTLLLSESERQRDRALAEHQRALNASDQAQAQARELHAYRSDYEQRWGTHFSRQGQIELIRCYQSFMERLTQAVDQQLRIVERARQQVERAQSALTDIELRCASMRKLIERRQHERRLDADRRDQKHSDELASRAAWSRRESSDLFRPN